MKKIRIITAFVGTLFWFSSYADDPLNKPRIIPDVELIVGDASRDGVWGINYKDLKNQKNRALTILDSKLSEKFDRTDAVVSGNVAAGMEDEILVAYGKKRKKGKYKGKIAVYAPDMHVIYTTLDVRFEKGDGLALGYLEKDKKGYDRLVIGSRARDTLEVWSFFPPKKLASFKVGYEINDKIATGDVDGDGFDEIIMGDASRDEIRIFKYNPKVKKLIQIKRFKGKGIFDINDRLGAGDVDGDGIDEIVFLNNDGKIYFYDMYGNRKGKTIKVKYDKYSQMVVGDIDRNGYDEILVAYAKDDKVRVYDYRGRVVAQLVNARFERYDSLTVGDIDGDSVIVGKPKKGKITTRVHQIIAVINAPPKEKSLIRKDGSYFYASFDEVTQMQSGIKVEAKKGVITTHSFKSEPPVLKNLLKAFSTKVKRKIEHTQSKTSQQTITKTVGYGLKADRYDTAITIKTTYQIYAYPIMSPKEFAFKNGKQQYVIIFVPLEIKTTDIDDPPQYISSNHITGYVASYPNREGALYNYTPSKKIGSIVFDVRCDDRHFKVGIEEANITVEKEKQKSEIKADKNTFMDSIQSIVPGMSSSTKKTYTDEMITTHTISFTKSTVIGVHLKENAFNYCLTEEGYNTDKYKYKVGVVVYYDKIRGYLVIDYFVPEKSPYFKPPPKPAPPAPMLMKDGKLLLKLQPVKNLKINPKIKLPM